jgi:hypothetical protein
MQSKATLGVPTEKKDVRLAMNADRRKRFGTDGRTLALVCECIDAECRRTVLMSPAEYDAIRPGLVLHPDHNVIGGEQAAI